MSRYSGLKHQQNKIDKMISVYGIKYTIVNSWREQGKALKYHVLKIIALHRLIPKMPELTIISSKTLRINKNTIGDCNTGIQTMPYEDLGFQHKIRNARQIITGLTQNRFFQVK